VPQVVVADTRKAQDRWGERATRIRERQESLTERHPAVARHGEADRADLDDRFGLSLVARGLEVDRDQDPVQGLPI